MNIYVSVISDAELDIIRQYQLGYEIITYADPKNLDDFEHMHPAITRNMQGIDKFSMHGAFHDITYLTNDPLILEITKKRFLQSIQAASFHGVNRLVFHSAYRTFFRFKESATQYFIQASIDFWKDFEHHIPDGMTVFLENVEDEDPYIFAEVINGIDSPKVNACLDVGHAFSHANIPLNTWIKVLGHRIGHVHLHDNDGINDLHLPLGKGNIPLYETLCHLKEYAGENVPCALECHVPESLDWLKKNNL